VTEQPTTPLADELAKLTVAKFDAIQEVGYFLPLTLHADLIAALRNQQAPSPEGVEALSDLLFKAWEDLGAPNQWPGSDPLAERLAPALASHDSPTGCSM
jgi:hypothetical protein